jgi:Na+-driven multidrug efflux pump
MFRRSPHDREILRLAAPALGALAAEPLYLLADTAIVGHLATRQLAALALAATLLMAATTLCNVLSYATTAQVARYHGAGDARPPDGRSSLRRYGWARGDSSPKTWNGVRTTGRSS